MAHPKVMIIGSDSASDLYGSELAKRLIQKAEDISLFGVGGGLMQGSGVELLYDISGLNSIGACDSTKGNHIIKQLVKRLIETMDMEQPDLVIQIGLPVFNLRITEFAKSKGIPVFYYNTPINWCCNEVKINRLAKTVDQVIGVSRYEVNVCNENQITADFIGHPLVDIAQTNKSREELLDEYQLDGSRPTVVFLPGTRQIDVKVLFPTMLKTIKKIQNELPAVQIIVGIAPNTISQQWIDTLIEQFEVERFTITADTHGILHVCDLAVVNSGFESIEASLANVPTIAVQKFTNSNLFGQRINRTEYFSMINFLMQDEVVLELVDNDFSEAKIFEAVGFLLENKQERANILAGYSGLTEELGSPGTIDKAAELIFAKLD